MLLTYRGKEIQFTYRGKEIQFMVKSQAYNFCKEKYSYNNNFFKLIKIFSVLMLLISYKTISFKEPS